MVSTYEGLHRMIMRVLGVIAATRLQSIVVGRARGRSLWVVVAVDLQWYWGGIGWYWVVLTPIGRTWAPRALSSTHTPLPTASKYS